MQSTHDPKEWTLMFYLASDNLLAPGVVSQLKAIKAAGYHPNVNVVTQFDPFVEGTPTQIFEVNLMNKTKHPGVADVGFLGNDPFVRNLVEDKLWRDQKTRCDRGVKRELKRILKQNHDLDYDAPTPPDDRSDPRLTSSDDPQEPDPQDSLKRFLDFCRNRYPAKRFALFILGHGVVVGNDIFLFDEHASKHSISLTELGDVLRQFKTDIDEAEFELISFHSCSVSSIEVAFELQDTAKYMLASQGPAFVGSWPYRSILIRIFNDLIHNTHIDVKKMLHKIFKLCFFNSVDFLLAGYSFQLTLINLGLVKTIKGDIGNLVNALLDGLDDPNIVDIIQLAHLKSQSFYQEMYTDLYDFCFCIVAKVQEICGVDSRGDKCNCAGLPEPCAQINPQLRALYHACENMMKKLVKEIPAKPGPGLKPEQVIVSAEFLGPAYQYSRGLSVYFPWTRPVGDRRILSEYAHYQFHLQLERAIQPGEFPGQFEPPPQAAKEGEQGEEEICDCCKKNAHCHHCKCCKPKKHSWLTFLTKYFVKTMRAASSEECDPNRYLPGQCPKEIPCPHNPPCAARAALKLCELPHDPTQCQMDQQERELKEDIANLIYGSGSMTGLYQLGGGKTGTGDPAGGDCDCPSIKNYPRDTRPRRERAEVVTEKSRVEFTQAPFL